jgi:adenosylcobinamide-phosphate synthase
MIRRATARLAGAAAGVALDRALGEPPTAAHPVAWFGRAMTALEQRCWADDRRRGVAYFAVGAGSAVATGAALTRLVRSPLAATAVTTTLAAGGRMLGDTALTIGDALTAGDLDAARDRLPWLVGRDPAGLDSTEIARAAIESVAENTVDAVVAPLFWGAVGGAPAVLAHRAVNTLDAMVGHHSPRHERFGWASARADDAANWVPARMAAVLVAAVRPRAAPAVARAVRRDAAAHPSPNGGVIEAAYAAALGVRLGGTNRYADRIEHRGPLNPQGRPPEPTDIARAVALLRHVTALATALAAGLAVATAAATATRKPTNNPA